MEQKLAQWWSKSVFSTLYIKTILHWQLESVSDQIYECPDLNNIFQIFQAVFCL